MHTPTTTSDPRPHPPASAGDSRPAAERRPATREIRDFELASARRVLGRSSRPTQGWMPAVVPGGVHESLLAVGVIEHPYRDETEHAIAWIEKRDWWYRTRFARPESAPGERVRLVFEGLDTVADIWLNGKRLGRHRTMFRPAAFDVTDRLQGQNELVLRFAPPLSMLAYPLAAVREGLASRRVTGVFPDGEGPGIEEMKRRALASARRKATFSWGWDFAPRVPSLGIWKGVRLVVERGAAITGVHARAVSVDAERGAAELAVDVEVDDFSATEDLRAIALLATPDGDVSEIPLRRTAAGFSGRQAIERAQLWWTHDRGPQPLYRVEVRLLRAGEQLASRTVRTGLRTIALDRSPDPEGGALFRFLLNGTPIFARGANWVPNSMLVGSIPARTVRDRVLRAREGGMNMIRVWGGGIIEQDAFYEACDEQGVLVWQDFLFACVDYPSGRRSLREEVSLEAEHQIRTLRNHASLALWCGNNEVQMIHGFVFQDYAPGGWGWHIFHRILPEAVERLDGAVPYWPGSPWGESPEEGWRAVNGVRDGDRHAWEVWHGADFGAGGWDGGTPGEQRHYRRFENDRGKFISEFGIHAAPVISTLEKWTRPGSLELRSPAFQHRNKDVPKDKHDPVLEIVTGIPQDLREYVDFTMASQAEGLKFGIEHYRRRQPHCNGTLVWQFNDAWPGFSWSIVDYEGAPKAGYYAVRRAFDPVIGSFRYDRGVLELWVSNSGAAGYGGELGVRVEGFGGEAVLEHRTRVQVDAGQSRVVWSGEVDAGADRVAIVTGDGIRPNRLFFAEIRDLALLPATLHVRRRPGAIEVTASAYAYAVQLLPENPLTRISDNFRDIRAGESVEFLVRGEDVRSIPVRGYAGQRIDVREVGEPVTGARPGSSGIRPGSAGVPAEPGRADHGTV